jgi:integrase
MTIVRVRGIKRFLDRHGKWRCYHRKTGLPIKSEFGSGEFFEELARPDGVAKHTAKPKAGTLGMLITEYRASAEFNGLAPRTQADYLRILDYIRPISDTPLVRFDRALVVRIRDKASARGRRFANYVKAVLSILFSWGVERGLVNLNPAERVKNIRRPKGAPDANRPWTDSERHVVLDAASPQMKPALNLMMFTGLGPKDALNLPRSFYKDGEIATRRSKTGEPVFWPAPAPLREALSVAAGHNALTLCANSDGRPWTGDGFRASWRTLRLRLERSGQIGPSLTLYGLRHTVAVILRECGFDERTIADALGQKTIEMARHYARGADLKAKMRGVVAAFDLEMNERRTKAVKPS